MTSKQSTINWQLAQQKIKLLCLDVDGVLTDGRLYYAADHTVSKCFYVQDGAAIKRWKQSGRQCVWITARDDKASIYRAEDLQVTIFSNCTDKLSQLKIVAHEIGLQPEEIAYIGDDLIDITCMKWCSWPIAVANAQIPVLNEACYVTKLDGGYGAVAEVIHQLMRDT